MKKFKCRNCKKNDFKRAEVIIHQKTVSKKGIEKIAYFCNPCNTKRIKAYRKSPKGRIISNKAVYASIKRHPEKQKARAILNESVRKGIIVKPKMCSKCKLEKKLEAHHPRYSCPLFVMWMCRPCHSLHHRKQLARQSLKANIKS